jgi:3'-5' exoribonuclease
VAQRTYIRDLQGAEFIEGVFALQNCQLGQTKGGKPYLRCLIADRTGKTPGRMWNTTEELFRSLPTDGFAYIEGQTQPYQGEMQIIIQTIRAVEPSEADLLDLLPRSERDAEEMFDELKRIVEWIEHAPLKALVQTYLDDDELMALFKQAPAAMSLHHAYLGGLIEHTLSVMKLAELVVPLYPQVNRDLVLVGLFLHDLGKCVELTWKTGFGYSEDGQLIGHVARGVILLDQKLRECEARGTKLPAPLTRVLHHIILSHHGKFEFGALKIPATPEAIAVSHIDDLDAKLHMAIAAARSDTGAKSDALGGHFTEKIWALDTRIYRPDPTTLPDDAG